MAQDTALQKRIQRIGTIVEQLESAADANSRALAKELLESLMALHGAGLERILELAREAGETGHTLIGKCGRDELVSSLLLLYGLHPDDLNTRVTRALEKSQSFLDSHAARARANLGARRRDGYSATAFEAQRRLRLFGRGSEIHPGNCSAKCRAGCACDRCGRDWCRAGRFRIRGTTRERPSDRGVVGATRSAERRLACLPRFHPDRKARLPHFGNLRASGQC